MQPRQLVALPDLLLPRQVQLMFPLPTIHTFRPFPPIRMTPHEICQLQRSWCDFMGLPPTPNSWNLQHSFAEVDKS
jgi:hypothetical protein